MLAESDFATHKLGLTKEKLEFSRETAHPPSVFAAPHCITSSGCSLPALYPAPSC
jgi:hypothetical protein